MVNFIARLISILHSAISPKAIAAGFTLGMVIGLTPSVFISIILTLIIIILNVNIAAALLGVVLFRTVAYVFDPFFHSLGYFVLVSPQPLRWLFTLLYNTPFIPFTRYNNSVVMGCLITALFISAPLYIWVKNGVISYRTHRYFNKIQQFKVVRYIRASEAYQYYKRLKSWGDKLWR